MFASLWDCFMFILCTSKYALYNIYINCHKFTTFTLLLSTKGIIVITRHFICYFKLLYFCYTVLKFSFIDDLSSFSFKTVLLFFC